MSWTKIRRRATDRLFSQYIRQKHCKGQAGGPCQFCNRWKEIGLLDVSHFWSRRHESTRFDEKNCDVFCKAPCHRRLENEKGQGRDYWNWKLKKLGKREFDLLMLRAHQTVHRDDKMQLMVLKVLMKELEEKSGQNS